MANRALDRGLADDRAIRERKLRKSIFSYQRKTAGEIIFRVFLSIFFVLFALTFLYPFWYTIILSFSGIDEAISLGLHLTLERWRPEANCVRFPPGFIASLSRSDTAPADRGAGS